MSASDKVETGLEVLDWLKKTEFAVVPPAVVLGYRTRKHSELSEMIKRKAYTVSDGEMVLSLEAAEEGGYVVTSPLDPELITEAETLDEAFANAKDAADALNQSRTKLAKQLADAELL